MKFAFASLVFSFGSAGDQIYVGGTAVYPGKGSTIELASSAIRPILGGAGKYQGATGWCQTEHLADGSWRHIFHLTGGTAAQESEATQASPSTGIIRSELGNALPATAPGQTLSLWHYSIPAGSKLMPHKHPGWQVLASSPGNCSIPSFPARPRCCATTAEKNRSAQVA